MSPRGSSEKLEKNNYITTKLGFTDKQMERI